MDRTERAALRAKMRFDVRQRAVATFVAEISEVAERRVRVDLAKHTLPDLHPAMSDMVIAEWTEAVEELLLELKL
ncbi:hypothetical protein FN976_26180 [Caenimonas sedimenti]|uniref:Uncharacterized protein n=1 Tax=Caenimonas sedimenti TaxID=2596921 RepID=A0A562ZGW6_9BURK|nr:hypothetical protein [Caenimonas sedimenti]TWO67023.1 hypothetical protein FN976_26180 [Caenimonas sedimenti]